MDLQDRQLKLTPKRIEALNRLGIYDTDGLLSYYPYRYEVINGLPYSEWKIKDTVCFQGTVAGTVRSWGYGKKTNCIFDCEAFDHIFKVTIFNRPWAKNLNEGQLITLRGIYQGKDRITAISYDTKPLSEHEAVTPVYSIKEGIQQRTVRACIDKVYEALQNEIDDLIPAEFIRKYRLLHRVQALRLIHHPSSMEDVKAAVRTLKYEEFLLFFTTMAMHKADEGEKFYKQPRMIDTVALAKVIQRMPYALTEDQNKALQDILHDLASPKSMYRIVQGDVGCGKTAVAALGMYACVTAGYQAALLAPTEILARQHLESLRSILQDTGIRTEVLYSGMPNAQKAQIIEDAAAGKIDILTGTHSLLQEDVHFHRLGMVVADEQQRFGVEQRRSLREKGENADFLLMSATPIPRTLASTLFGDMDISTIETMPPGRIDPVTVLIRENSFRSVLADVSSLLQSGRQLYVICAAVEKNAEYDARNVYDTAKAMQKLYPMYTVDILHGRMSSEEKQTVMEKFHSGETKILVSTTVVEVGMNVVNATGMIIYDADRFGLSQLHQLRGRIQRGSHQGTCWLLSGSEEERTLERLQVLVQTNNGFEISYQDLRLRGPGDILGTRQSGVPDFILGNLAEDTNIIDTARKDAAFIMAHSAQPGFDLFLDRLRERSRRRSYVD